MDEDAVDEDAVPGLAAKDVIDIDLTVADPRREEAYVPPLAALGYDLTVREPSWHEHRMLRLEDPRVNLHVFGPSCPELARHAMFRDWLRAHPEDRATYAQAKEAAAPGSRHAMECNARKASVVQAIYERIAAAHG
ncbi:GrpB family protein [Streptomyces sp. NPDC005151]